jgi:hypothetical protein
MTFTVKVRVAFLVMLPWSCAVTRLFHPQKHWYRDAASHEADGPEVD